MLLIQNATKLIAWLSGSLAGITAILYACGYLAGQSFLHLLGISGIVQYSNQDYLRRGASFCFDLLGIFGNMLLPLVTVAVILAATGAFGFKLCKSLSKSRFYVKRMTHWLTRIQHRMPWLGRGAAYGILLALFFTLLFNNLELFTAPLSISELLYYDTTVAQDKFCQQIIVNKNVDEVNRCIRDWIFKGRRDRLEGYFQYLIIVELAAGFLLVSAWRVTMKWRLQGLFVSPFVIIFIMYITLLPAVYGVLMIRVTFPTVHIESKIRALGDKPGEIFLVSKTEKTFILWDSDAKQLLWVPFRNIEIIRFMKKVSPFR